MDPLGPYADDLLRSLSTSPAGRTDQLGQVVRSALQAGGARSIESLDSPGEGFLMQSNIDLALGDVAVMVKEQLPNQRALRQSASELLPLLRRNPSLATFLVLYGAGLDDQELTVDFEPGRFRFLTVQSFVERLREDTLHDVVAGLLDSSPRLRRAQGQVAAVDPVAGAGILRGYDADIVHFELGSAPLAPGEPVNYTYRLTVPEDVQVARDVTVDVPPEEATPAPKHISAIVDGDLKLGTASVLRIKVGNPLARNLLAGDVVVPPSDIPPEGLDTDWTVSSADLEFHSTAQAAPIESAEGLPGSAVHFPLHVPATGDSATMKLPFTPSRVGVADIQIRIHARGALYRSLSAEVEVGGGVSRSTPVVRRDITATRADRVGTAALLSEESLRLEVLQDGRDALLSGSGATWSYALKRHPWPASVTNLDEPLKRVRAAADAFREKFSGYLNAIDHDELVSCLQSYQSIADWSSPAKEATQAAIGEWEQVGASDELKALAAAGHKLYEIVFPERSEIRNEIEKLRPGALLDISWSDSSAAASDVPWTLMYAPAPDAEIDPMGFLGLRFRIKYLAYATPGRTDTLLGSPAQVSTACCMFWGSKETELAEEVRQQRTRLASPKRIFIPSEGGTGEAKTRLLEVLRGDEPVGVLYMYCHYGRLKANEPGFRFGDTNDVDGDVLSLRDLETISVRSAPLVFANACATSGEDALHTHPIKQHMFSHGAAAYLGTEAKVPVAMASRFATVFLHLFEEYRQEDEPLTVGEALSQARLLFWRRYRNIGGLFYSLVNEYTLQRRSDTEKG